MILSLIVAMTENGVIGHEGGMPWRLSADLRRFKRLTMGHHLIMGRKTYDSIGRPLPGRTSVVISRNATIEEEHVEVVRSLEEALEIAAADTEAFITGGAEIYRLALPHVQQIHLTRIHATLTGDTHFPEVDWSSFTLVSQQRHAADDKNDYDYSFLLYERNGSCLNSST